MIVNVSDMPLEDKRELARDPNVSPEVLEELFTDSDTVVKYLVLVNPNSPESVCNAPTGMKDFCLGIDFSHSIHRADESIYKHAKRIVNSYDGEFKYCSIFGLEDDHGYDLDNLEYVSSIDLQFSLPEYRDTLGDRSANLVANSLADEVEDMIYALGYDVNSSDWF